MSTPINRYYLRSTSPEETLTPEDDNNSLLGCSDISSIDQISEASFTIETEDEAEEEINMASHIHMPCFMETLGS